MCFKRSYLLFICQILFISKAELKSLHSLVYSSNGRDGHRLGQAKVRDWKLNPGSPHGGAMLEPSSSAFPGALAGLWVGSGGSRDLNQAALMGHWYCLTCCATVPAPGG